MIYGVLAVGAGLSTWDAQAMSAVMFAGSAQFMIVQMLNTGTPVLMMILTGLIINLRHMLYSASISPYTKHLSPLWKAGLSYLLTDEAYAVVIMHYRKRTDITNKTLVLPRRKPDPVDLLAAQHRRGHFPGRADPRQLGVDFTLALTFIALVMPSIDDKPSLLAALSAGLTALLARNFPYKLGLIAAAFVGIAVGLWSEKR
jgi:predicted branched-subunit amino acid permease